MLNELREKLNTYAKRAGETASMVGVVMLAVPLALIIAVAIGLLLSSSGIGFITFFIALAALIMWLRDNHKETDKERYSNNSDTGRRNEHY